VRHRTGARNARESSDCHDNSWTPPDVAAKFRWNGRASLLPWLRYAEFVEAALRLAVAIK